MPKRQSVTKTQLISTIAKEKKMRQNKAREIIQSFLDKITDCLGKGDRIEFRYFGIFEVVKQKPKIGRNPKNAAIPIIIPARLVVKFFPGKGLIGLKNYKIQET